MGYFGNQERLDEFRKEILKEKEHYRRLQVKVTSLLQEGHYEAIYGFFHRLISSDYAYVFLMSRRCLVLCQIFVAFFVLDDRMPDSSTKVLSDQAIPYYRKKMRGCKVAIVDDILIHGRTVSHVYDLLKSYCGGTTPDIPVYMADTDIDCLRDEVREAVIPDCVAYKGEWRNLSNKIVNCIYASNVPYTSFVTAMFQYKSPAILDALLKSGAFIIEENTEYTQKSCGLSSYYCYERAEEKLPLFQDLSMGESIRIYWNEDISKLTVIPYVFVRSMEIDAAQQVFDKITEQLPDYMVHIKAALQESDESDSEAGMLLLEYKMRLLTSIMSNLYWNMITEKYQLESEYYTDVDTLDKSFGEEIADELQLLLHGKLCDKLCQLNCGIVSCQVIVEEELEHVLDELCNNAGSGNCGDLIKLYFQKTWQLDEHRAKDGKDRMHGLPLESFVNCAQKHKVASQQILMNLVNSWDTGIAAANYAVGFKGRSISCYNTPGEQSYKITLEKNPYLMYSLIYMSKAMRKGDEESDEAYEIYRMNKLIELLDCYHHAHPLEDYEDIKDIIIQEKGYLNAWNQTKVLRTYMIHDQDRDEALVRDFIEQNL